MILTTPETTPPPSTPANSPLVPSLHFVSSIYIEKNNYDQICDFVVQIMVCHLFNVAPEAVNSGAMK